MWPARATTRFRTLAPLGRAAALLLVALNLTFLAVQVKHPERKTTYYDWVIMPSLQGNAYESLGLWFARHADKVSIKAKQGETFTKDPIARAMLEGSSKPKKIIYKKNSETVTQYGVTRSKEVITLPVDFEVDKHIEEIIAYLKGERTGSRFVEPSTNKDQTSLM